MENDYNDIIYSYDKKVNENVLDRSIAHDIFHGERMTENMNKYETSSRFSKNNPTGRMLGG